VLGYWRATALDQHHDTSIESWGVPPSSVPLPTALLTVAFELPITNCVGNAGRASGIISSTSVLSSKLSVIPSGRASSEVDKV